MVIVGDVKVPANFWRGPDIGTGTGYPIGFYAQNLNIF
jgi:hypothetical protein